MFMVVVINFFVKNQNDENFKAFFILSHLFHSTFNYSLLLLILFFIMFIQFFRSFLFELFEIH